jgi:hypothetical protein
MARRRDPNQTTIDDAAAEPIPTFGRRRETNWSYRNCSRNCPFHIGVEQLNSFVPKHGGWERRMTRREGIVVCFVGASCRLRFAARSWAGTGCTCPRLGRCCLGGRLRQMFGPPAPLVRELDQLRPSFSAGGHPGSVGMSIVQDRKPGMHSAFACLARKPCASSSRSGAPLTGLAAIGRRRFDLLTVSLGCSCLRVRPLTFASLIFSFLVWSVLF